MKITFKQYIYLIFLIGFVAFVFATCSKHVTGPFLDKKPEFQKELVFQKTHEARVKTNVETLLERLLGKKNYVVSVVTLLNNESITELRKEHEPKVITRNQIFEENTNTTQEAMSYLSIRPSTKDIREEIAQKGLPGLNMDLLSQSAFGLPGFPVLPERTLNDERIAVSDQDAGSELNLSKLMPLRAEKEGKGYRLDEHDVVLNERSIYTTRPQMSVRSILLSVVVDSDYFEYLDLSKDDLEALVFKAAGLDAERNDQLSISYMPFIQKGFSWVHFFKKNKVLFEKIKSVFEKFKPIFIIALLGVLILVAGWALSKVVSMVMRRRQERLDEFKRKQQEIEDEEKAHKESEVEEMRRAILQLAQTKPDQLSSLLDSWVETDGDNV